MPQQIVFSANTMDFWRQSLNGLVANVNFAFANSFNVSGNVIVRGGSSSVLALNVANGQIYGNGYLLFSLNAVSFIGIANNSRLQNTFVGLRTQLGLSSNITNVSLGQTLSINVAVVNSITNTRTDLPAAANSIVWAMAQANTNIANASLVTSGTLTEAFGGTGEIIFANGETLIGNSQSTRLDKSTITAGLGISTTVGPGSLRANLNIVHSTRMMITAPTDNGAFQITANGYDVGSTTQAGVITFVDNFISTSITQGVTANAANALVNYANANPGISNAYGRLLAQNVYTTSNYSGTYSPTVGNTRYTWNKHPNCAFVKIIAVGPGGAASNSGPLSSASRVSVSAGGGSGAVIIGIWDQADFGTSEIVQVGGGGFRSIKNSDYPEYTGFINKQAIAYGGMNGQKGTIVGGWLVAGSEHGISQAGFGFNDASSTAITTATPFQKPIIIRAVVGDDPVVWNDSASTPTVIAGAGGSGPFGKGGLGAITRGVSTGSATNYTLPTGYGSGSGGSVAWGTTSIVANTTNGQPGLLIVEQYSKL